MKPMTDEKFKDELPKILNALHDWFASQGIVVADRVMISQIYTAAMIRAVATFSHSEAKQQEECLLTGMALALEAFQRAMNGEFGVGAELV